MGFFAKRLDFSEDWYPTTKLGRIITNFLLLTAGLASLLFLHIFWDAWDPHRIKSIDGLFGQFMLYFYIISMSMLIFFNITWMYMVARWMGVLKGMRFREFRDAKGPLGEIIEELLVSKGLRFTKEDRSHRFIPLLSRIGPTTTWYHIPGHDIKIVISKTFGYTGKLSVFLGPVHDLNRSMVKRLQRDIDGALLPDRAAGIDGETFQEQKARSSMLERIPLLNMRLRI
jgi:hypothetical protein